MAKYTVLHSCNHQETVNLVGSHESREWRLKRMASEVCFACYRQAELQVAQEEAVKQELPELHGSVAQIAWAETLRIDKLRQLEDYAEKQDNRRPLFLQAIDVITMETSAHQWIEWRDMSISRILHVVQVSLKEVPVVQSQQVNHQAIALGEATLRPESPRTETVVVIAVEGDTISVSFPEKREDFRGLVRFRYGCEWKYNRWQRVINPQWHGTPQDRASEIGHALLSAGFSVRCFDESIRNKMLSGEFVPECTRWIKKRVRGTNIGWFTIEWGRHEDLYVAARKIKRSLYDRPLVIVPPEQFEEVLDFAEIYHFQLSAGAQDLIEQAKLQRENMLVVKVEPINQRKTIGSVSDIPPVLKIPDNVEIADDLKDEA